MPIGIQRLNAKKSQPNPNIIFIKPLKGPDEKVAQDFLERIAAQCLPVMREHHIHVMALEEFPPNREFVGRNFNAGEVIQLVLKSPGSGRWLPFNYVQMVMMHELAHCKQMNHSKAFWAVRNQYAAQMQGLWGKGYKGDGVWGRGATLGSGEWERNTVLPEEILPELLCGGTYRSRRGKRKLKARPTYQEQKERRILKKFGKNGVALGADDEAKVKLEKGKRTQAKPRVASSVRGRELRAAAALARFEPVKDENSDIKAEEEDGADSDDATSDYEGDDSQDADSKDAVDIDGSRLVDQKGKGMVKVCEEEDVNDPDAKKELDELQNVFRKGIKRESPDMAGMLAPRFVEPRPAIKRERVIPETLVKKEAETTHSQSLLRIAAVPPANKATPASPSSNHAATTDTQSSTKHCSMCSFANSRLAATCSICSNVLDPGSMPRAWRCSESSCADTNYLNAADCGICGLCGQRRRGSGNETAQ